MRKLALATLVATFVLIIVGGVVRVSARETQGNIELSVADNGIGIAKQDLPKLGNPFVQANNTYGRVGHGTGLGLSVVSGLAELHGGRLVLFGRAGLGPTIPHAESRIGSEVLEGYELGAVGLHLAGGLEIRLWRGMAAMAEYKLTHTNQTVSVVEGQARGLFTSHHGVFGLVWHFGWPATGSAAP